ncbi:MAG: C-terminal binding protein [Planctomycetes bacterium]|nr:C-terminal binding protein [Planctomycetota bacterium]
MYDVVITDYIAPPADIEEQVLGGLARLRCLQARSFRQLFGQIENAHALIVFHEISIPAEVIGVLARCRIIVRAGAGFDNIDLDAARARGIMVCNVPDYGVDEVADHAMALMLACQRGIVQTERRLRASLSPWDYRAVAPVFRLADAIMGIIGLGRIGTAMALRCKALKMNVLACDPYVRPGVDKALGVTLVGLEELLRRSDVVSLHVPLTEETRAMIDARALAQMKPTAILINTARGAVVDVEALAAALQKRRLAGAGIDVLPHEPPEAASPLVRLWQSDADPPISLVLTPHSAFYSEASLAEMRSKAAREVASALAGGPLRSRVI